MNLSLTELTLESSFSSVSENPYHRHPWIFLGMNDVNADAPPPGEWTVVGDDPGHKDHIPGWRKELLPEDDSEAQSLEIDPCFQYCYKSSLLPFKDR